MAGSAYGLMIKNFIASKYCCWRKWGGAQGVDDTIFPATMEIDYVGFILLQGRSTSGFFSLTFNNKEKS
jgi:hypothetical protein